MKVPKIPTASRGRGSRSVDLAVRLGDGWQVFRVQAGESVRRISLEDVGPEVVRCSPSDRVLHLPGLSKGKVRETLMRELRSIPAYRHWGTWVIACPRSEAAIAGRRVRPLAAAVAEKAVEPPSIMTMRIGERLAVMWPVGKDGSVGACEVAAVESDADLKEFAGNLAASVGLEGTQVTPLEAIERWLPGFALPEYPQEGEWFGRPVVWYARAFAAGGTHGCGGTARWGRPSSVGSCSWARRTGEGADAGCATCPGTMGPGPCECRGATGSGRFHESGPGSAGAVAPGREGKSPERPSHRRYREHPIKRCRGSRPPGARCADAAPGVRDAHPGRVAKTPGNRTQRRQFL